MMPEDVINLKVDSAGRDAFVLCLALGTLEAMRSGVWPLEAGIWTIGRPIFWEPLKHAGMAHELIELFQTADELGALEKLNGRAAADTLVDQMIGIIRGHMGTLPEKSWRMESLDSDVE